MNQPFDDYKKEIKAMMLVWDNHRKLEDFEERLKKEFSNGLTPQEAYNLIFPKK